MFSPLPTDSVNEDVDDILDPVEETEEKVEQGEPLMTRGDVGHVEDAVGEGADEVTGAHCQDDAQHSLVSLIQKFSSLCASKSIKILVPDYT